MLEDLNDETPVSDEEPEVLNEDESTENVDNSEEEEIAEDFPEEEYTTDEENLNESDYFDEQETEGPQQEVQPTIIPVHTQKEKEDRLNKYKSILIGVGIAILLVLAYILLSGNKNDEVKLILNTDQKTIEVGADDTLTLTTYPEDADVSVKWESSNVHIATVQDGIVTAHSEGNVVIKVYSSTDNETSAKCHYSILPNEVKKEAKEEKVEEKKSKEKAQEQKSTTTSPKESSSRTLDLGYAKYSGDIRNGKPDGAGIMTFKRRYMAGRDFSGEEVYAEQGDRLDGNFSNGYLQVGTLYQKDGNTKKIKY